MVWLTRFITTVTLAVATIWIVAAGVELFVHNDRGTAAGYMVVAVFALFVEAGWRLLYASRS